MIFKFFYFHLPYSPSPSPIKETLQIYKDKIEIGFYTSRGIILCKMKTLRPFKRRYTSLANQVCLHRQSKIYFNDKASTTCLFTKCTNSSRAKYSNFTLPFCNLSQNSMCR